MDEALIRWAVLGVLLFASAFFSGSEVAFFSLTRLQLDKMKESGTRTGTRVYTLHERPQKLLVSIYVGNELINVAISAVSTVISMDYFGSSGVAYAIGVGTFVLLVFGEITPKTLAHYYNATWSVLAVYPLTIFMTLIFPVERIVTFIATGIAGIFGVSATVEDIVFTEDELKYLMEEGADEGVIDEEEKEMIQGVFELGDQMVSEVMTPRADIFAIDMDTPLKEAWDTLSDKTYARVPVHKNGLDNVTGFLFKKDLLKLDYPPPASTKIGDIMHKAFIVPETMNISELLQGFKKRKTHMAVAMDEYGSVQGVVTMDNIIAELVRDASSVENDEQNEAIRLSHDSFRIPGGMELESFNEHFKTNFFHQDIETIGGYVFHKFGAAPKWGESLETDGMKFTVEGLKGSRIIDLKLKIEKKTETKEEAQ